jgi:uncharacterized protein (UPF0147 family)
MEQMSRIRDTLKNYEDLQELGETADILKNARRAVKDARQALKDAREALNRHTAEHGC